jgi:hypothetical protein
MEHPTRFFFYFFLLIGPQLIAQAPEVCPFSRLVETDLIESYWSYVRTIHSASGKTIHQGGKAYPSYLHFRFDNTFEEHTNGVYREGKWALTDGRLMMTYRGLESYCADMPVAGKLTLGFNATGGSSGRHYEFNLVESEVTPFLRPWYELPTIIVDKKRSTKPGPEINTNSRWWAFWESWQREPKAVTPVLTPITIEVSGGGYYGGLNPVSRQYVRINSEGRIIREVQTQREGLMVTKKHITRRELEDFAEWIEAQGYFNLEREYDCKDQLCYRRKSQKPKPIPLQVMVAYGHKRHVITVHIWGLDHNKIQYAPCPPVIDQIVETVYRMADRVE